MENKKRLVVLLIILIVVCATAIGIREYNKYHDEMVRKNVEAIRAYNEAESTKTGEYLLDTTDDDTVLYCDDLYAVGTKFPEGEYKIFRDSYSGLGYCKVINSITESNDKTRDDIVNFVYVTISENQYLILENACAVSINDVKPYVPDGRICVQGMYKVGFDIPPGEYNLKLEKGYRKGTYTISKDSPYEDDSIIYTNSFKTEAYVTVTDGQYLNLRGCYLELPAPEETVEAFSRKIEYNDFIERFDDTLILLTVGEDLRFLRDYEFVEIQRNKFRYILEIDGDEICTITVTLDNDYIDGATFVGMTESSDNMAYTVILGSCFERGLVKGTIPKLEYGEVSYFDSYSVVRTKDDTTEGMMIIYKEP